MPIRTPFDRFVTAVHRRAVVIRVLERIGLALAAAAGVGGVMAMVAGWRGVTVWPAIAMLSASAVVIGAAWGWINRPSMLAAATEADRQLDLADLLASALLADENVSVGQTFLSAMPRGKPQAIRAGENGHPWQTRMSVPPKTFQTEPVPDFRSAVRAMAERACETRSPSQVILNRLGARAWGGIGLAWAMVIVVGLLASGTPATRAGESDALALASPGADGTPSPQTNTAAGRHTPGGHDAWSDATRRFGTDADPATPGTQAGTGDGVVGQSKSGAGGGASRTDQAHIDPSGSAATPQSPSGSTGSIAGGTGAASSPNASPGSAGGTTAARPLDQAAPPWATDPWPADRAAAMQAVHDGRVPDAYRDLVREYFSVERK